MTPQTYQILGQIIVANKQLSLLTNAATQIQKIQNGIASFSAQLTPDNEPDPAALAFAQSQISAAQDAVNVAAKNLGVEITVPVAPANPAPVIPGQVLPA